MLRVVVVALALVFVVSSALAEPGNPTPARLATQDVSPLLAPSRPTWSDTARSLQVRFDAPVRLLPRNGGPVHGRIAAGTRVSWRSLTSAPRDPTCPAWVAIEPRGYLCETELAPSEDEPHADPQPAIRPGQIVPDRYDPAELTAAGPLTSDLVTPDGKRSCTPIDAAQPTRTRERGDVSDFVGLDLTCPDAPALPFAWVQSRLPLKRPVAVFTRPRHDAAVSHRLAPRTLVPLATATYKNGFVSIGPDAWVLASDLHVARLAAPPPRTLHDERWIDVDLDEQVLVAYEGTRPVYATLVATGTPKYATPPRVFRIAQKIALATMAGDDYRALVPWTMYLDDFYALHSAYWHDRFGSRTSHGCINLPPLDARVLYHWTSPAVPPGWLSARPTPDEPGTLVRLKNRQRQNPPFEGVAQDIYRARAPARSR